MSKAEADEIRKLSIEAGREHARERLQGKGQGAPSVCPHCRGATSYPLLDPRGHWTWQCKEGCNP